MAATSTNKYLCLGLLCHLSASSKSCVCLRRVIQRLRLVVSVIQCNTHNYILHNQFAVYMTTRVLPKAQQLMLVCKQLQSHCRLDNIRRCSPGGADGGCYRPQRQPDCHQLHPQVCVIHSSLRGLYTVSQYSYTFSRLPYIIPSITLLAFSTYLCFLVLLFLFHLLFTCTLFILLSPPPSLPPPPPSPATLS